MLGIEASLRLAGSTFVCQSSIGKRYFVYSVESVFQIQDTVGHIGIGQIGCHLEERVAHHREPHPNVLYLNFLEHHLPVCWL